MQHKPVRRERWTTVLFDVLPDVVLRDLDREKPQPGAWRAAPSRLGNGHLLRLVSVISALTWATVVGLAGPSGALADKWHIEEGRAIEDPPPDNLLFSASCPSAKVCVAVGYDGHGNFQGTFVETMNNNSWTVTPSPVTASPCIDDALNAVSCTSPTSCAAAGRATDGSWRITPSPDTSPPINDLYGVQCATPTCCIAVGDDSSISAQRALVETLSGGTWKLTPSPGTAPGLNELFYAWYRSRTSCGAAGFAMNPQGTEARTLIETLTGGVWRITPSPNTASALNELYGYSCASPSACYAVGVEGTSTAQEALIESSGG